MVMTSEDTTLFLFDVHDKVLVTYWLLNTLDTIILHTNLVSIFLLNLTPTIILLLQEQRAYLTAATAKQAARSPMKLPPPRIPVPVPASSSPTSPATAGSALASTGAAPEECLLNSADRKTVVEILGR